MSEHTESYDYETDHDDDSGDQARERRLSPGRVVDGILEYTRSHPGGWTAGVGQTVRRNALPIAMIGAGVLWMVAEGGMRREPVKRRAEAVGSAARDAMDRTLERTRSAIDDVGETAGGMVRTATDRVREGTREAAVAASRYGRRVGSTASRTGQTAWRAVERTYEENPLALGMLVALGAAAVALSIPATRREDELMGEIRDDVADKARKYVKGARDVGKAAATAAKSEMKSAAKAVAEAAKSEAKAQGLVDEQAAPAKSHSPESGKKEHPGL